MQINIIKEEGRENGNAETTRKKRGKRELKAKSVTIPCSDSLARVIDGRNYTVRNSTHKARLVFQ
jgi:hypothetical protein